MFDENTKAEKLLGGSIETSKTQFMDVESRKPLTIDHIMQRAVMMPGQPRGEPMIHGVVDMIPKNDIAFSQYIHYFGRHAEEELFSNVMGLVTGKGSTDHPRVQSLIHHSFGHIPELISLYNKH